MEEVAKALLQLLAGQPVFVVLCAFALLCLTWKLPELLNVWLTHLRENRRILSDIGDKQARLDHDLTEKRARISNRSRKVR